MNYEIFIMGDQPTTCSKCGSRTDWEDLPFVEYAQQLHTCLGCGFVFLVHDDQD